MWQRLLTTSPELTPFMLRLILGLVILPHGLQKAFGLFGGYGFTGTMGYFTDTVGVPYVFGVLAILAETLGALFLIFGALTRLAALAIGTTMVVAALTVHLPNGFFMNWFANQKGEGIEYFVLATGLALALIIQGAGAWSVDRLLSDRVVQPATPVQG